MIKNLQNSFTANILKKKEISPLFICICIIALLQFIISLRWIILDKSPIQWDQSGYMLQATITYKTLVQKGIFNFIYQLFNYDRGRVDLVILLVQPFFKIFGIQTYSAMISLNICWFITGFAIYGLGKEIINNSIGKLIGVIAFLFFGLYQFTTMLTHNFLVEFYLVTVVTVFYYFIMIFYRTKSIKYSYFIGISIGLGLMIKVTFVAFLLPLMFLIYNIFKSSDTKRIFVKKVAPIIIFPIILSGPFYFYNLKYIIQTTQFLSSVNLANLYGFGEVFNIKTILDYLKNIFIEPTLFPITIIAIIITLISVKKLFSKKYRFYFIMLFSWFIIPVMLSTFGAIKDSRYLYPALVPLFLAAGVGISVLVRKDKIIGIIAIILICILPLYQFSVSNGLINKLGIKIDNYITFEPAPDRNDWKISETVKILNQVLNEKKEVVFLGGNKNYHLNLFRFYGVMQDININYSTIPYYNENLTFDEAMKYIKDLNPSGILYKTGENWPEFSNKYSKEIIEQLSTDSNYVKIDLNITQPDGSKFYMFVPKTKNNNIEQNFKVPISEDTNIMSNIDLSESVNQGNGSLLHIIGWGIINDTNSYDNKIFIVLKSEDKTIIFNTNQMLRKDITDAFGRNFNKNFDNSGFNTYIPENLLNDGKYRIGVCITNGDKKYLNFSNTYVTKNDDGIFNGFLSDEKNIIEYNFTNKIKCDVELIKNSIETKTVEISGFAFIQGVNNLNSKVFIALKSDDKELVFDTACIKRPDVTKVFGDDINIGDCGFQTFIPIKLLQNNNYKIGIIIEAEGESYLQYTNNIFSKK